MMPPRRTLVTPTDWPQLSVTFCPRAARARPPHPPTTALMYEPFAAQGVRLREDPHSRMHPPAPGTTAPQYQRQPPSIRFPPQPPARPRWRPRSTLSTTPEPLSPKHGCNPPHQFHPIQTRRYENIQSTRGGRRRKVKVRRVATRSSKPRSRVEVVRSRPRALAQRRAPPHTGRAISDCCERAGSHLSRAESAGRLP